jgi:hypothetical protein
MRSLPVSNRSIYGSSLFPNTSCGKDEEALNCSSSHCVSLRPIMNFDKINFTPIEYSLDSTELISCSPTSERRSEVPILVNLLSNEALRRTRNALQIRAAKFPQFKP